MTDKPEGQHNAELMRRYLEGKKSTQKFIREAGWQMAMIGLYEAVVKLAASGADASILQAEAKAALESAAILHEGMASGRTAPEKLWNRVALSSN